VQNAGTITFPPGASGGLRAATNFVSQLQYNTLAAAGTYTRMANVHLQGVYEVSGGNTFTITNAHQLLINSLNENAYTGAQLTITNRWGIYQDGASDSNYFAGVMQLGSTTSTGEQLQVTGTARVTQSAYLATASGAVGIFTTSIAAGFKLDVNGDAVFGSQIRLKTYSDSGSSGIYDGTTLISGNAIYWNGNRVFFLLGGAERLRFTNDSNVGIAQTTFGTSATATLAISSGTAPTSSPANCFQLYSADITAGNAAAHFRTEGGAVVKIYQQTTAVGTAARVGGGGTNVTDTDTFGGYTLGQIVQALQNAGFLA
jgi:hypothetical protein